MARFQFGAPRVVSAHDRLPLRHTRRAIHGVGVALLEREITGASAQRAEDQPQIAPDGLYSDVNTAKELADVKITLTAKELAEMDGRFLPDSTER